MASRHHYHRHCLHCGKPFHTGDNQQRCCDVICQRKYDRSVRKGKAYNRTGKKAPTISRAEVFKRDDYKCQLCGQPLDMGAKCPSALAPTIDHRVPLAKGGKHEMANVQSAHYYCNNRKADNDA